MAFKKFGAQAASYLNKGRKTIEGDSGEDENGAAVINSSAANSFAQAEKNVENSAPSGRGFMPPLFRM
ncbi:MAG TPA: hypothetical protein P5058_06890, partial [Eubacteriales bacterium]|nr:hypothetical protein [Eubacteriales bacterium]